MAARKPARVSASRAKSPANANANANANAGTGKKAKADTVATPAAEPAAEQLGEYKRKRNFEKTPEPSGAAIRPVTTSRTAAHDKLAFVIQKHAATQLHYDLRIEIDGVMKSWAVPKGPSADPAVKRLAMQVEDHPVEYNSFEGTIPAGEYGGGTVMLWDTGSYEIENNPAGDSNSVARDQYDRGELKIVFHGKRIKGSYALVRTKGWGRNAGKQSWLLIKHRDNSARSESGNPASALTATYTTSVTTGRTMDQITAAGTP